MSTEKSTSDIDYQAIDDPAVMEQELIQLLVELDAGEYDDFDEWETLYEEKQPQLYAAAKHAAELNIKQGLHLYGDLLLQAAKTSGDKEQAILTEARTCFKKAAHLGCWGAISDLARDKTDNLKVEPVDIVVYNMLDEDNANPDCNYWNDYLDLDLSETEFSKVMERYKNIIAFIKKSNVTKQICSCLI